MKYEVITEIEKPRSLYYKLTKGTILEPWIIDAYQNCYYFGAPFNIWDRHDNVLTRIGRCLHIGVPLGIVMGGIQGYVKNVERGVTGQAQIRNKTVYKVGAHGFLNMTLQTMAFPVTVSLLSYVKGREDRAIDWYFGGMSMAIVNLIMSQTKGMVYSYKYNFCMIVLFPFFPAGAKYLQMVNEYEDDKGGRAVGAGGGQQVHSLTEMRALYGIEPYTVPLDQELRRGRTKYPEMMFLKPRLDTSMNDKFRVEE